MKQTISTIYPPPPPPNRKKHMQKKTPQTLNGFQRGSQAGPQPPLPPSFLPFLLCNIKNILNGISLADRWLPDNVCWLG